MKKSILIVIAFLCIYPVKWVYAKDVEIPSFDVHVKSDTLVLRDAITIHNPLYGDVVDGICFGGTTKERFDKAWKKPKFCKIERDSVKGILIIVPSEVFINDSMKIDTLDIMCAVNKGANNKDNWCPDTSAIKVKVRFIKATIDSPLSISKEQTTKAQSSSFDRNGFMISLIPYLVIISFIELILIIFLFCKTKNKKKASEIDVKYNHINNSSNQLSNIKEEIWQKIGDLEKRTLKSGTITKDQIEEIVRNVIKCEVRTPHVEPTLSIIKTVDVPTKDVEETFDNIEYSFAEKKFVLSNEPQQIFVAYKKGNKYSYNFKNEQMFFEIASMLTAYTGCISTQGNTITGNAIESIVPGIIYPENNGRTYAIASPIIVNLK